MKTLVLDMSYQPLHAVSFRKAIKYVVNGKVNVIENYDIFIYQDWKMPAVVRLPHWISKRTAPVKFSRRNVLLRDKGRCQYCNVSGLQAEMTFDHVIPRSRGGKKQWDNIVTACRRCNSLKADRTPEEAGLKLIRKPAQPRWLPLSGASVLTLETAQVPDEWREYLFV